MVGITVRYSPEFRQDRALLDTLLELLAPSYVDARPLLHRELAHCDALYLYYEADASLAAFFLVAWEWLHIGKSQLPAVYLGLSATRQDRKNTAVVRQLYLEFVREAAAWEQATGQQLVLWYTTATPSACLAAYNIFAGAEPEPDGSFSEHGAKIATAVRVSLGVPARPGDHPFVLRSVAAGTRYSPAERDRISSVCEKQNFWLLRDLGVEEASGDRLLYVCYVPQAVGELGNPATREVTPTDLPAA